MKEILIFLTIQEAKTDFYPKRMMFLKVKNKIINKQPLDENDIKFISKQLENGVDDLLAAYGTFNNIKKEVCL